MGTGKCTGVGTVRVTVWVAVRIVQSARHCMSGFHLNWVLAQIGLALGLVLESELGLEVKSGLGLGLG